MSSGVGSDVARGFEEVEHFSGEVAFDAADRFPAGLSLAENVFEILVGRSVRRVDLGCGYPARLVGWHVSGGTRRI
jgi:hypothetical protein